MMQTKLFVHDKKPRFDFKCCIYKNFLTFLKHLERHELSGRDKFAGEGATYSVRGSLETNLFTRLQRLNCCII